MKTAMDLNNKLELKLQWDPFVLLIKDYMYVVL